MVCPTIASVACARLEIFMAAALISEIKAEEEISEISAAAMKISNLAQATDAIVGQTIEDTVYWMDVGGRSARNVSLHAAPINIAQGLKKYLFDKVSSV